MIMENNFSLGDTLKDIRLQKKLSQEEVALKSGITTAYYGLVERNQKNPTVRILEKICYDLEIQIGDIFKESINPNHEYDDVTLQILNQLHGRTIEEKKIVLNIIKQVFKLKSIHNENL
jgi:transcriptional regulator with XRE-family HTH domain